MEFSRQKYWVPFPSLGEFPDPGIKPSLVSPCTGRQILLLLVPSGKLRVCVCVCVCVYTHTHIHIHIHTSDLRKNEVPRVH